MLDAVLAANEIAASNSTSGAVRPGDAPAHIIVPDAHLLFNGEFTRVGTSDLKIVGDDGNSFFIPDYFAADKRAALISPDGASLSADVVAALAGPLAPGQWAQASAQQQSSEPVIGRVDALAGGATVVRNGVAVTLNIGDTVRRGDVVQTAGGSSIAIVFADGSTFSLSANARMVLNEFVYNAGGNNSALVSLVQGTFSFVAGQVAKTGDMRVDTPVATMGIRGTAVLVEISANDGQTRFSVMVEPDGTTGSFNLYDRATGSLIGTVNNAGVGWLLIPSGPLQVVAQQVQKTPAQLQQENAIVQQIFTIFNNNQQNPFVPDQQQQQDDPSRRGDNPNDPNPQTAQGGGGGGGSGAPLEGTQLQSSFQTVASLLSQPGQFEFKLPPLPTMPIPSVSVPDTVTVVVTPNRPPVAVDDAVDNTSEPTEDGNIVGDITRNDRDPEGGVIVVTSVQHIVDGEPTGDVVRINTAGRSIEGDYGTLTLRADGTYTFEPDEDAFRSLAEGEQRIETFRYTISDPFGATATAVLKITLTGKNDAPELVHSISDTAVDAGAALSFVLAPDTFTDVDGDELTYTATLANDDPLPEWLTFNASTRTFSGTPPYGAGGEELVIIVKASDGSLSASTDFVLTINDVAPPCENIPLGWSLGPNNHLYRYVDEKVSWEEAQTAALNAGGYLATITDSSENDFVFSLVGEKVAWLGGTDADNEGEWCWVPESGDNAFSAFTRWAFGEPNNLHEEDYLVTWGNHSWNDLTNHSDQVHGYVIERTPGVSANTPVSFSTSALLANEDAFVFKPGDGHDITTDFSFSEGGRIDLRAIDNLNFDNLTIDVVGDTIDDLGDGNIITLHGVTVTNLNENDFLFHHPPLV